MKDPSIYLNYKEPRSSPRGTDASPTMTRSGRRWAKMKGIPYSNVWRRIKVFIWLWAMLWGYLTISLSSMGLRALIKTGWRGRLIKTIHLTLSSMPRVRMISSWDCQLARKCVRLSFWPNAMAKTTTNTSQESTTPTRATSNWLPKSQPADTS